MNTVLVGLAVGLFIMCPILSLWGRRMVWSPFFLGVAILAVDYVGWV